MNKIKLNSKVKVISGDDRKKSGSVIKIKDQYLKISGLKLLKKSVKKNANNPSVDNFIDIEGWIHKSNVILSDKQEKTLTNKKIKNS